MENYLAVRRNEVLLLHSFNMDGLWKPDAIWKKPEKRPHIAGSDLSEMPRTNNTMGLWRQEVDEGLPRAGGDELRQDGV